MLNNHLLLLIVSASAFLLALRQQFHVMSAPPDCKYAYLHAGSLYSVKLECRNGWQSDHDLASND